MKSSCSHEKSIVEMSKKTPALILIILLIIFPTLITTTKGQINQGSTISFKAFAVGECLVAYGNSGGIGFPTHVDGWGIGKGIVRIAGYAKDAWPLLNELYYSSESIQAKGQVSINWREDGSKHHLQAVLYSTEYTEGTFIFEENLFAVPNPVTFDFENGLEFKGIHTTGSEFKEINGCAIFTTELYNPYQLDDIIVILLFDKASEKVYVIAWLLEGGKIGIPDNSSSSIQELSPAKVFKTVVKLLNKP